MNTERICRKFFGRWIIGNPGSRREDIINMNTIKKVLRVDLLCSNSDWRCLASSSVSDTKLPSSGFTVLNSVINEHSHDF
jgi:hypothetical protein